jgi:hypothetical protein
MPEIDMPEFALKAGVLLRQIELLVARLEADPTLLEEIRQQLAKLEQKWGLLMDQLRAAKD